MATPAQIEHINQHLDRFHGHAGDDRTPEEYLNDYSHIPDIYERLCHDLGLTPIQEPEEGTVTQQVPDLAELIRQQVQEAMNQQQQPVAVSFEDVLTQIDPRDSDAALAMYEWLHKNGRLHVLGTLNGGGYIECYQEPKGTTKAGYAPGSTVGGRMVDAAVEKAQADGKQPLKRGLCPHCYSAVYVHPSGAVVLDDETGAKVDADAPREPGLVCEGSPDGRHAFSS